MMLEPILSDLEVDAPQLGVLAKSSASFHSFPWRFLRWLTRLDLVPGLVLKLFRQSLMLRIFMPSDNVLKDCMARLLWLTLTGGLFTWEAEERWEIERYPDWLLPWKGMMED